MPKRGQELHHQHLRLCCLPFALVVVFPYPLCKLPRAIVGPCHISAKLWHLVNPCGPLHPSFVPWRMDGWMDGNTMRHPPTSPNTAIGSGMIFLANTMARWQNSAVATYPCSAGFQDFRPEPSIPRRQPACALDASVKPRWQCHADNVLWWPASCLPRTLLTYL